MYRNGTPEDCGAIYALVCEMENKALPYDRFAAIYQSQLRDGRCQCLVCELDGAVAGFINLRCEEQLHHAERIAEILELVVEPGRRRQGVGKGLLAEACRAARRRGCPQIEVACNQVRKDSHRFYQREGLQNTHYKFSMRLDAP